ncbi:Cof-type HAD-IIB family hydrolase [Sebaldella sp. S0638]|uniref:Cof-type HAD-IIB family hydrolase n=1 Tax=Sebaldella sp. S0638 TaxID=2957809 RepID=UPI00209C7722|nr:Cof-type HAD-IIB family hydrolase [Sebaldella sp. S0638]MCP1222979.1 Cof-type HAD-IIB family hydrolase [Sebaldella sp. S0638]
MKYKMLVTDVDDTLLTDGHEITKENREAIMELQRNGVKFVLASGRPTEAITGIARELELPKYGGFVAGYNGGEILDMSSGNMLKRMGLKREELLEIYEKSKDIDLKYITYKDNFVLGKEKDEFVDEELKITNFEYLEFEDLQDIEFDELIKCMLVGRTEIVLETKNKLEPLFDGRIALTISKPIFLEFINKNASKGNAVRVIADKLGITLDEVAAIGDSYNDISMLEIAGFSGTVENGNDEAKKTASFISSSNNNSGLARFVEEMKKH